MEDYLAEFHRLLDHAEEHAYLPHTGAALDQAAKLALENNDEANALLAKYLYVFAVAPIEPERALVAFAWCISRREVANDVLPHGSLAQLYGIAIGILRSYPAYSLDQIEATFERMSKLYDETGLSRRDLLHQRIYLDLSLGRRAEAAKAYTAWQTSEIDRYACHVCDLGTRIIYRLHSEDFDGGLRLAKPLLEGNLRCEHGQPLLTHAASILPLLRQGEFQTAGRCYQAARHKLGELSYAGIWTAGRLLSYMALSGRVADAEELLREHGRVALKQGTPADRFGYLLACRMLAHRLVENADNVDAIRGYFEVGDQAGPSEIQAAIQEEIDTLAAAFDARNGNGEYSRIVRVFETVYHQISLSMPNL